MELSRKFDSKKIESEIKTRMKDVDLQKLIRDSEKPKRMRFIEGPPTMNGVPHAGHLRGRVIKDVWYRYQTLQGNKIEFDAGWDAQGLPVELQAEKELGITGGKTEVIKKIGIERLVAQCKDLVQKYNQSWVEVDMMLGMSFDQKNAYWTYKDEFIEREWQVLKKGLERGILEEDYTVIAYCPSCQTSLSHAEVNQGYEEVRDPSLYYKVKLAKEDAYLIVWTTMPFTLVTDAMVGLDPEEDYNHVTVNEETWIIGDTRMKDMLEEIGITEYTVSKTSKGSEFEGKKYIHPLLGEIPELDILSKQANYHVAVSERFVDASTGSGLVHLSPANGEEDIGIANRRKVQIFSPIDDEVKFTADAGKYAGLFVRDADETIVKDLKNRGALVKIGKIRHKYPLCWRSHHRIVWLARKGWFYKLDRLGDAVIDAAESVEYFYPQPKNRFLGIIREKHPWCISRERVWGSPLPAWHCEDCSKYTWCFSRKDITESATDLPDGADFELHRPWIDNITVRCRHCSSTNTCREQYVLDTWHNSGSAPFSSLSDAEYAQQIPAPFFTEGIDQTRGWAYTLLVENVILNNASPYASFLFQGHVLDEKGNKMSKSKGNVLDGMQLLTKYPADMIRFYFIWKSSPIEPLSFDTRELMSRPYQVQSTLYHLHLYYKQNSSYDGFEGAGIIETADLTPADVWILSKLQGLVAGMTDLYDRCRLHESARAIEDYIINSLSQTYIPITRAELWDEQNEGRRHTIYAVLSEVLRTLDILLHPVCPFVTEYLYLDMFAKNKTILLETWPKPQDALINKPVEESFDLMSRCVSISAAARTKQKLKRRWPLNSAIICVQKGEKKKLESLSEFLLSQINVQECVIHEMQHTEGQELVEEMMQLRLPVTPVIHLKKDQVGPKAKGLMGALIKKHEQTDAGIIMKGLQKNSSYTFNMEQDITLQAEDFEVSFDAMPGYALSSRGPLTVIISATRNREMTARGLVKDVARRIQSLRKEKGYNPTDMLQTASILGLDEESEAMIRERAEELAFLVRVKSVEFTRVCQSYKNDDIDGRQIQLGIQ